MLSKMQNRAEPRNLTVSADAPAAARVVNSGRIQVTIGSGRA